MKILTLVFRIMLVIPVGLIIWHLLFPDDMSELVYLTIGLPIIVFNAMIWEMPEAVETLIFGDKKSKEYDNWSI
jgi:hypothetical protein